LNNINVSADGFNVLPTNMDLQKYDYLLDFSITGIANNTWLYLRFNNDAVGSLTAWDSCLIFNPNSAAAGNLTVTAGTYTKTGFGNTVYWLNGGSGVGAGQPIQIKATYKISAVNSTTFVVSLEQCQPVSFCPAINNTAPYYQVFASQIKYTYSNNHATRWAPSHIGIFAGSSPSFTNLNCCITQCIRSTVATTH
jgi:hypothetical protein